MEGFADGAVLDAHVVRADVVALSIARVAGRQADAQARSGNVRAITSLQERRRRWTAVPPYFPGDAA